MALAPPEHFVPREISCHIDVADNSVLYQRTCPNLSEYLNFLLTSCCISIDLPSKILLHLLLLNFYTHTRERTPIANGLTMWACGPIAFGGRIEPQTAIYYTHI
jgi:hypothetical protein